MKTYCLGFFVSQLYTLVYGTILTHVIIVMFVDLSYVRPYPYLSMNSLTCLKLLKTSGTTSGDRRGDNHRMRSPIKMSIQVVLWIG